jgi:CelD/BcsL family acetyltransferase involved in cellulose biosynthesis
VFSLPNSLDDFFEAMDKDERKKRKYELRVLRRNQTVTEDVITDPSRLEEEFDGFARLHAQQWRGRGKLGHFGSWPRALEYNRALVKAMARSGRVRFVRILSGGDVISSQYAFVFGSAYFWELPARRVDQKWQRFSLGPAGFFALVDAAMKEGKTRVEGGLAHYDYKQKLNAREYRTRTIRVLGCCPGTRLRSALFLALRFCLLWLYLKIWYARISPRLPPAFRAPLWPFWLRLDF